MGSRFPVVGVPLDVDVCRLLLAAVDVAVISDRVDGVAGGNWGSREVLLAYLVMRRAITLAKDVAFWRGNPGSDAGVDGILLAGMFGNSASDCNCLAVFLKPMSAKCW